MTRHFLADDDLTPSELVALLDLADDLKRNRLVDRVAPLAERPLAGRSVAVVFEKSSTRTRLSFEIGIAELGAHPILIDAATSQISRGETIEDTGRVMSRMADAIVIRTHSQERIEALAASSSVPVVNALTNAFHPCQALSDLQTIRAHFGRLEGVTIAYLGDGNNVACSLLLAGAAAGMTVRVASPADYQPDAGVVARAARLGQVEVLEDPQQAIKDCHVIYTDVWTSMGQEAEAAQRHGALAPYQVNAKLLGLADPEAVVLHCLPAHRGEEITAEVIDGPRSLVWDQAENRLHAQKALLLSLLDGRLESA